jgi:hypothetical protein
VPAPDQAFWPTPAEDGRPLVPAPGLRAYALKGMPLKVIGISVCGFSREEIEPLVEFVEQHQSQDRRFVPVFLTDSTEANIFRRRGFVFEYLPPPARVRLRGSKSWADYAGERRRLLARKWGMADIITFGEVTFGRPHVSGQPQSASTTKGRVASVRNRNATTTSESKPTSARPARTRRANGYSQPIRPSRSSAAGTARRFRALKTVQCRAFSGPAPIALLLECCGMKGAASPIAPRPSVPAVLISLLRAFGA